MMHGIVASQLLNRRGFVDELLPEIVTPSFVAASSAVAHTTTSLNVPYPASIAANQILLLWVNFAGTGVTMTTPAGFAQIGSTQLYGNEWVGGGGNDVHSAVYWKRATGSESGNLALTKSGAGAEPDGIFMGSFTSYQDCIETGDPFEAVSEAIDVTDPYTMASVTTLGALRRVVCGFMITDNPDRAFSGDPGPAAGWTNRHTNLTFLGEQGVICVDDAEQLAAGSPTNDYYGAFFLTHCGIHAFALKPRE